MEIEKLKLLHDHTKHVTTLSTGAILILVAFYEKLPKIPVAHKLIPVSLLFFVICILSATLAQIVVVVSHSNEDKEYEKNTLEFTDKVFLASWVTFAAGMVTLCITGMFDLFIAA
ncbi:MAG TPA: hypothetical protein VIM41_10240 [Gammaproteobacteria bacterium]